VVFKFFVHLREANVDAAAFKLWCGSWENSLTKSSILQV